uniref:calmodulin-binding transcription activator 3-like n=1 Tax=Fragaria vesca subsp. vesca TaxID=101020 RepID=UPI0005CAD949|nr:PREDICTED: calmodulin-binding transcription activator 3-like [Fragaria vesca subsp. vesca]
MAARKRLRPDDQLEIPQILLQAHHRWLHPAEICQILRNHTKFRLSEEHADTPEGGTLSLYDRKVLRSFRKDGYKWKRTKDGKAVKEAHERLKVGGVEVLHCYYAHGEENENFQRRCYWMIEKRLSHIVLVHYRDVKTSEGNLSCSSELSINRNVHLDISYHASTSFPRGVNADELLNSLGPPCHMDLIKQNESSLHRHSDNKNDPWRLKNLDSSNQCMNTNLGDQTEPHMSSSEDHSNTIASENGIDGFSALKQVEIATLGSSLFQDLLFNIMDFSPNWAYERSETKVVVVGRFLKSQELDSFSWSCMFGEVEVPAEVVADGVLRCHTPIHRAARIPFYVTCSNRLACSEVKIFEYRVNHIQDADFKDNCCKENTLVMRFGKLLSPSVMYPSFNPRVKHRQYDPICVSDNSDLTRKISSLLKNGDEERAEMLKLFPDAFSLDTVKEQLLQQFLKDKFHEWLLKKLAVGGNGLRVLDEGGQGVLHFGAALGYDWVLSPMKIAGVSINFRDVNGWTALHWAAFCGRDRAVALLISLGGAPGALTDPCTKNPTGKTPADLASENGYKGIAGYLAASSLSAHISSLKLDIKDAHSAESSREKSVQPDGMSAHCSNGDLADELSMRVCSTAVCDHIQASARIHQVFSVQPFQRKQLKEYGDKSKTSDEGALSLSAVKSHKKCDQHVSCAAIQTPDKFRNRNIKDFLIIRSRILKIQANVRGHQERKSYTKILWAVGILEKIILRWRRKRSGLRGFKREPPSDEGRSIQVSSSRENDYDFLKEGRKQTEERLQNALARVKSMVQIPEARDQYNQLSNIFTEIQETKVVDSSEGESTDMDYNGMLQVVNNSVGISADMDYNIIDTNALLDDNICMYDHICIDDLWD